MILASRESGTAGPRRGVGERGSYAQGRSRVGHEAFVYHLTAVGELCEGRPQASRCLGWGWEGRREGEMGECS